MAELSRLRIAVDEIKKDFDEFVKTQLFLHPASYSDKPHEYDRISAELQVIASRITTNMQVAIALLKSEYPEDVLSKFENETQSFEKWKELGGKGFVRSIDRSMTDAQKQKIRNAIVFFETLLVTNVSADKEIEALEYQLNRLSSRFAMGSISEYAYMKASKSIEDRIQKLKSFGKRGG